MTTAPLIHQTVCISQTSDWATTGERERRDKVAAELRRQAGNPEWCGTLMLLSNGVLALLPVLLALGVRSQPLAVPRDEKAVFDLFAISNVNRQTPGVKLFRGPDPRKPAFRFSRFDKIPAASGDQLQALLRLMNYHEGFILTATLRQDRKSRGTLLLIQGPGYKRQLQIVSNGVDNTLDLQYSVENIQNLASFHHVDIADSQWKNITIHVNGENANLYVDCELADSFILDDPIYEQLSATNGKLYVAKGLTPGSNFRGYLQNMHLIFGSSIVDILQSNGCLQIGVLMPKRIEPCADVRLPEQPVSKAVLLETEVKCEIGL
ncbi:hypothetical protein chiPu_0009971 [Chiloscyllium punctatum]|uniref:Thrombospondin-like N-terminal domain-containing protein n=1 Tax=Chiloscyllium punctatum TaxID=137246 RepID=A0A401SMB0_CHIPU|nr:hypothetical protein [Chiloscyllium punctatum]